MMRRHCWCLLFLLLGGRLAHAKVVYVDQNASGPVRNGESWSTAYHTVAEALSVAVSGDEVWVANGIYEEAGLTPATGVALYGGFAGTETERDQRDWRKSISLLAGDDLGSAIVICDRPDITVDGFSIFDKGATGVLVTSTGTATLENNSITWSDAGVDIRGTATLSNNRIAFNSSGVNVILGSVVLANNTIAGNGTGIFVSEGEATLTNNTITGNARDGLWVNSGTTAALTNNIVAHNSGFGVTNTDSAITAFSHNNVFGNTKGNTSGYAIPDGQGNISLDPKLSNPYHTIHIQPDSPCRDAGSDSGVVGTTDIDGQPRIQGARVDIGSDESDGTLWAVPSITWYVSPDGSDTNDGKSWTTAKRTVTAALDVAQGTDEVWVEKGTYAESDISPAAGVALYGGFGGTETQRGQQDWRIHVTILDGGGADNVVLGRFQNVSVSGFTVQNGRFGIHAEQGTLTLTHNTVSNNSHGIHANFGSVEVSSNVLSGNGTGLFITNGEASLTNNTISGNSQEGVRVELFATAALANNIVAFNSGFGIVNSGAITGFSHNDVFGNARGDIFGFTPPADQGNLSVDPLFIDRVNGDYRLQDGSPLIDAGHDAAVAPGSTDLDGKPRVIGQHVDIGAYEYGTPGPRPFTLNDVLRCIDIAYGGTTATADDLARLNVEPGPELDLRDAVRIARKVDGLEPNP